MLTLTNKLYESLLDDEGDLVNDNTNLLKDVLDNIKIPQSKYEILNNNHIKFMYTFNDLSTLGSEQVKTIFKGDIINEIDYILSLTLVKNILSNINTSPIFIKTINNVRTGVINFDVKNTAIKIDNINYLRLSIDSKENISTYLTQSFLKETNIDKIIMHKSIGLSFSDFSKLINNKYHSYLFSGIKCNQLILEKSLIDCIGREMAKTETSIQYFDYIFKNNSINKLYIYDLYGNNYKYYEVKKSTRSRDGYILTRVKMEES